MIDPRYQLQETSTVRYLQRTEKNAVDSDATVSLTVKTPLAGGLKQTAQFATKTRKAVGLFGSREHHLHHSQAPTVIRENSIAVLNMAGLRGSKEPAVYGFAYSVLASVMGRCPSDP